MSNVRLLTKPVTKYNPYISYTIALPLLQHGRSRFVPWDCQTRQRRIRVQWIRGQVIVWLNTRLNSLDWLFCILFNTIHCVAFVKKFKWLLRNENVLMLSVAKPLHASGVGGSTLLSHEQHHPPRHPTSLSPRAQQWKLCTRQTGWLWCCVSAGQPGKDKFR